MTQATPPETQARLYFSFFNEIGIISHLSSAVLESRLPPGMLAAHFKVLNHLVRVRDGRSPLEMANAFQVPKTTMTHHVKILEGLGYVRQMPNPADGRYKQVWLTPAGRTLVDRTIEGVADIVADWSRVFDPEEVRELAERLERIRIYLDAARNPKP